jgi:spermidine synthase
MFAYRIDRVPSIQKITTVEIDPTMILIGKKHFRVDHPKHRIVAGDGISFLASYEDKYDVIWVDACTPDADVIPTNFKVSEDHHL